MSFLDRFIKSPDDRLHDAIRDGDLKGACSALRSKANPSLKDGNGMTPLHHAAIRGRKEIILELLKAGAQLNAKDELGREAIHLAAGCELKSGIFAMEVLLEKGADPKAKDDGGCTPLHYAAHIGSPAKVACLLRMGANPNARDNIGTTPVHRAARASRLKFEEGSDESDSIKCLAGLLGAGGKATERDDNGYKPKSHAGKSEGANYLEKWEIMEK